MQEAAATEATTTTYPWTAILEAADNWTAERAEDLVIAERGPLTRHTSEKGWAAYWTAVAAKVQELSAK